jgi:hypothetical protein
MHGYFAKPFDMRRSFFTAVCAIAAGNAVITLFEKLVYSKKHLDALHEVLIQSAPYSVKGTMYPPELLFQKMMAWIFAAFVAGLVTAALRPAHRKYVLAAAVLFFMLAALVNVAIVPHPYWFTAVMPAVFIVPLLAGAGTLQFINQVQAARPLQGERPGEGGMQPATV